MRSRLATLVRGSSRPDTVLRFRPAHLRVTVVVAVAVARELAGFCWAIANAD
jgi:hypothetical protein